MAFTYSVLYAEGLIMPAIPAQRLQTAKNILTAGQRYWSIGHNLSSTYKCNFLGADNKQ